MVNKLATTQGKEHALEELAKRRESNKTRARVDDWRLPAGSPMHFDCLTCGGEIVVPELWLTKPDLCRECEALKRAGWLE